MTTRAATLHEAVHLHQRRVFQGYVKSLLEIFHGADKAWDLRLAAWDRAMRLAAWDRAMQETPYLEDDDRALLSALRKVLFDEP